MDHHARSSLNWFTDQSLDRIGHRRSDEAWIREQIRAPRTRFVPVFQDANLFAHEPGHTPLLLSAEALGDHWENPELLTLLGEKDNCAYFLLNLPATDAELINRVEALGRFAQLRAMSPLLDPPQAALLAYARALGIWHQHHRFCGACGSPTRSCRAGHQRVCTNPRCGHDHFPRTDPAIIVLIANEHRCLLGRQPTWPPDFYSTIAGFVEPGETLEQALVREVKEETGVSVEQVHYQSSQPWPFPSSIMLGFVARPVTEDICLLDAELADARWFSRDEVMKAARKEGRLRLPPRFSVARRLIEDWLEPTGP